MLNKTFGETLEKLSVQVSPEKNVIETNHFFFAETGDQSDRDKA